MVFLKSAMRTRGSERASREAKAVQWRTFGFGQCTYYIARGWNEHYKLLKIMKIGRTNSVGSPESSVGPPSAAQKLVKNNYNSDGDGDHEGRRFQFSLPKILHLRARAVRVVVMM